MAISGTDPVLEETIGGKPCRLLLRNGEIERFEAQYAPFGIFELFDQLMGRGPAPQVRHVRDIIALGLVGGGMDSRAADAFVGDLSPAENITLRATAQRLLGVTFIPAVLDEARGKKRGAGSRKGKANQPQSDTTPETASETSSA